MSILSFLQDSRYSQDALTSSIKLIDTNIDPEIYNSPEWHKQILSLCQNSNATIRSNGIQLLISTVQLCGSNYMIQNQKSLFECLFHLLRIGELEININKACEVLMSILRRSDQLEAETKKIYTQNIQKLIQTLKILLQNHKPNYKAYLSVMFLCCEYFPTYFKKESKYIIPLLVYYLFIYFIRLI